MSLCRMLIKELTYRKMHFLLALLAVVVAVGVLIGAMAVLDVHDHHTDALLEAKQAEMNEKLGALNQAMRKATLKLGFNLVILPEKQDIRNWHAEDAASEYMPENYVKTLAESGIITVRHFLPILQRRVKWPEYNRTIILFGTRGEVSNLHKKPVKPLVQPVPEGTIVLGHELHQSLKIKEGETVKFMERPFKVHKCHAERGNRDDITAWISLKEAQILFDRPGQINVIYALECLCAGVGNIAQLRRDIQRILPGTQALELGTRVITRAETRLKAQEDARALVANAQKERTDLRGQRENFAALVVPVIMLACVLWIAYLEFNNVKSRVAEIGILKTLGYGPAWLLSLFLVKSLLTGLAGGVLGYFAGNLAGQQLGAFLEDGQGGFSAALVLFKPAWLAVAAGAAAGLALVAGWLPALWATRQDPADILRHI